VTYLLIMKPISPGDTYTREQMLDPKLHEPPTAGELLDASFDAAGKGAKAGFGAVGKILKFIFWTVIFLAALKFLLPLL